MMFKQPLESDSLSESDLLSNFALLNKRRSKVSIKYGGDGQMHKFEAPKNEAIHIYVSVYHRNFL